MAIRSTNTFSRAFLTASFGVLLGIGTGHSQDMDVQGDGSNGNIILQGRNISPVQSDKIGVKGVSTPAAFYGIGVWGDGGYQGVVGNAQMSGGGTRRGVAGVASGASGQYSANYGVWGSASGNNAWALYASGNIGHTGSIIFTSDARVKKNIEPLTGNLDALMGLKPKKYEYRVEEFSKMKLQKGEHYGLLAQDVEAAFPHLVQSGFFNGDEKQVNPKNYEIADTTNYKGINYIEMIPILIGAIQEQQALIEDLNKKLAKNGK